MFYVNINEWVFTTACGETQGAPRPVLWNTEVCSFDVTFRNRAGIPVEVTGCTFAAAVDNNFIHTDQLAAYTEDFQILDAQGGIVRFTIQCSSAKFSQLVYAKETTCRMDIYMWPSGSSVREVLLSDKGVVLRPVLETVEGEPEQSSPTYYNKSQIDSLLKACAGAVSTMPAAYVDTAGMMYIQEKALKSISKGICTCAYRPRTDMCGRISLLLWRWIPSWTKAALTPLRTAL